MELTGNTLPSTIDGHMLCINDTCLIVEFEDDGDTIAQLTPCIYHGNWIKDNRHLLPSPIAGPLCSGVFIAPFEPMCRFEDMDDHDKFYDLLHKDVSHTVIKSLDHIRRVLKLKS